MTDTPDSVADTASDRAEALASLERVKSEAERKAYSDRGGRLRDPEREKIRVRYLKCVVSACNAQRRLLKDQELHELSEEVEQIKSELEADGRDRPDVLAGES